MNGSWGKKREAMNKSQQFCRARLSGRVSVFLVLWTIGMGPVLTFSAFEKRAYQHWNQHVMQAGWFHPLPGTAQGFQSQQHTHQTRQDTSTKSYTPTWDISGWFMIAPVHNAVVCCVIVNFTICTLIPSPVHSKHPSEHHGLIGYSHMSETINHEGVKG